MVATLLVSQRGLVVLVYVFLLLYWRWPNAPAAPRQPTVPSKPPRRQRSHDPKPCAGLIERPQCAWCAHKAAHPHAPPPPPPAPRPPSDLFGPRAVFSAELGRSKPDPEAFRRLATRLACTPDEILYFDDDATYVTGAREAGLLAHHVGGAPGVRTGLAVHGLNFW
jgi:hypothetical protein